MKTNTARNIDAPPEASLPAGKNGHGEKLSRKAQTAILALLANPTIPKAAKASGISETTLWRWLQQDNFREKYKEAQNKVFDEALGNLQGATTEAVNSLRRNLHCKNPSAEVHAARTILDYSLKAHEIFELQTRITHLEEALRAREEAEQLGLDGDHEN